jgi:hypothetical protein
MFKFIGYLAPFAIQYCIVMVAVLMASELAGIDIMHGTRAIITETGIKALEIPLLIIATVVAWQFLEFVKKTGYHSSLLEEISDLFAC